MISQTQGGDIGIFLDPQTNAADLKVLNNDLAVDPGLETAVLISIFTDRKVDEDEQLPEDASLGGYWADQFPDIQGDLIGSRLWLLRREKTTQETLNRAIDYTEEALQWLIDDGIAQTVDVSAAYDANKFMVLSITITKPQGSKLNFKYKTKWDAEGNKK